MSGPSTICPNCGKPLEKLHGNKRYHTACAYLVKKRRSISQYARQMLKTDPFWKNERILKELYFGYGERAELDPMLLENSGFDFELFRKKENIQGVVAFVMTEYCFSILKNEKIIIWKL